MGNSHQGIGQLGQGRCRSKDRNTASEDQNQRNDKEATELPGSSPKPPPGGRAFLDSSSAQWSFSSPAVGGWCHRLDGTQHQASPGSNIGISAAGFYRVKANKNNTLCPAFSKSSSTIIVWRASFAPWPCDVLSRNKPGAPPCCFTPRWPGTLSGNAPRRRHLPSRSTGRWSLSPRFRSMN